MSDPSNSDSYEERCRRDYKRFSDRVAKAYDNRPEVIARCSRMQAESSQRKLESDQMFWGGVGVICSVCFGPPLIWLIFVLVSR